MPKPTQKQLNDPKWWDENIPKWVNHYNTMDGNIYSHEPDIGQEPFCAKRPTKPAFVPEVGVACEYSVLKGVYKTGEVLKVTKPDSFNVYAIMDSKTNQLHWVTDIRPIKSERELFVEAVSKVLQTDDQEVTGLCNKSIEMFHSAANALYDIGCRLTSQEDK